MSGMLHTAGTACSGRVHKEIPTVRKIITYSTVAFVFYLVVQFPDDAVRLLTNSRDLLGRFAEQSASFVRGTFGS